MDANVLLQCFSATLESNRELMKQAEQKLQELRKIPGFLGACLDIIADNEVNLAIKKATAVYFKNRVIRFWNNKEFLIDNDEKPIIRERIVEVIIISDYTTKQQLIPVLRTIIATDFNSWPGLLPQTGKLLTEDLSDSSKLYTGLLCFSEVCRKFRWMNNDTRKNELDVIIEQVFPHLLAVGKSIIDNFDQVDESIAEILKLILKCYKFVTYYDLPLPLQQQELIVTWGQFHHEIINMPTPKYVLESTLSEQEKSFLQISKVYKWSIKNIYRLFTRYASTSLSKLYTYKQFHDLFLNEFIPEIISSLLKIIEQWCSGQKWVCTQGLFNIAEFLSHSVTQKSTWLLIKPYYETLISHFVFPLLCPDDEILELFDEQPQEYINLRFDIQEEFNSPDIAALGLLATFSDKRRSTTLQSIVTFAHTQLTELSSQPQSIETAKKMEGALRILGCISIYAIKAFENEMEPFLFSLVFPLLSSKYDFLKARALDVASKFADIDFKEDATLQMLFHGILTNFESNTEIPLPVSFQAALAIQSYLSNPKFKPVLSNIVLPTMSKLLELSNEIDNDSISIVMQECVENFSEQLQPFGVDLMTKLVEQLMRLSKEIHEASNVDVDAFDENYEDQSEKVMAATGLLNTMITVLLSFENSQELCLKLEEVFFPAIEYILTHELEDFLAEIGDLMDNSTFLLRSISPVMWKLFDYLFESFKNGTALMYLEELISCLTNFLIYGQAKILEDDSLGIKFFKIFELIIGDNADDGDDVYETEIVLASELAQNLILSLQLKAQKFIPSILKSLLKYRFRGSFEASNENNAMNVNVNNVLIASLVYNTKESLQIFESAKILNDIFKSWFILVPKLTRVYDVKLSILGLMTIINDEEIIRALPNEISLHLFESLKVLIEQLPKSIKELENKRKNFDEFDFDGSCAVEDGNNWEDHEEEFDEEEYQKQLELEEENGDNDYEFQIKNGGYFNEADEEVVEDPLAASLLDNIDISVYLKQFLFANQDNVLFNNLSNEDKTVFKSIIDSA